MGNKFIIFAGTLLCLTSTNQAFANCQINGTTTLYSGAIQYNLYNQGNYWVCDGSAWQPLKHATDITSSQIIYDQDFEGGMAADEWGADVSESLTQYIGPLPAIGSGQGTNKTFTLSGTQDTTTIEFDFYEMDRFNGAFNVFIDDTIVATQGFSPSTYETGMGGTSGNVTWSATTSSPVHFDFSGGSGADNIHRFVMTITNPGVTSVKVGFGANASLWGIDNFSIIETASGVDSSVYTNDFESGTTANEWGNLYTDGISTCLGRYSESAGNQIAFKNFTLSGTQDSTEINLDFYELDSWDGENFQIYVNDTLIFNETFSGSGYQNGTSGSSGATSWTMSNASPFLVNMAAGRWDDQKYTLNIIHANPGDTNLKVGFSDTLNQAISDESWCVDNISVDENIGAGTSNVYTQDFEGAVAADEWGTNTNISLGGFLGRFAGTGGAQGPNKTYTLPGSQSTSTISFDVYEIDDWDGEAFQIYIDDTLVITENFNEGTFDIPSSGSSGSVSWTAANTTGALENLNFGSAKDQVYSYTLTIANPGNGSVKLGFGSTLNESVTNESWGIDNIIVQETTGGSTSTISSENFQSVDSLESWTNPPSAANSANIFSRFLGQLGGNGGAQGLNRTFAISGAQNTTTFVFDFYEIDSWDTENFRVYINDAVAFTHSFRDTVYDTPSGGTNGNVSWTVQNMTPDLFQIGFGSWSDQIIRYTVTVTNPGATTAKIGFGATLNGVISDESWGIDNVRVFETASGVDTSIYSDNFESGASGWSSNTTTSSYGNTVSIVRTKTYGDPNINIDFNATTDSPNIYTFATTRSATSNALIGGTVLGPFAAIGMSQFLNKTFTLPGTQDFTIVEFDIIEADTWDTEPFAVFINDTQLFTESLRATTYNIPSSGALGNVTWSSFNINNSLVDLGFSTANDQTYRYRLRIDNSGETSLKLGFGVSLDGGSSDEAFAVDNVKVKTIQGSPATALTTCTSAENGRMYYSATYTSFVFCDESNVWRLSSPTAPAGAGCSTPGEIEFSSATQKYSFCNGSNWIEMGG